MPTRIKASEAYKLVLNRERKHARPIEIPLSRGFTSGVLLSLPEALQLIIELSRAVTATTA
jgi:hypothetical protein